MCAFTVATSRPAAPWEFLLCCKRWILARIREGEVSPAGMLLKVVAYLITATAPSDNSQRRRGNTNDCHSCRSP